MIYSHAAHMVKLHCYNIFRKPISTKHKDLQTVLQSLLLVPFAVFPDSGKSYYTVVAGIRPQESWKMQYHRRG